MATARALPAVVAAARAATGPDGTGRFGVYVDGGIRSGQDVLAALALGAQAVFVGRPVLWALACGGAAGVGELLSGLTSELAHLMALAGAASVPEVPAAGWLPEAGLPVTGPGRGRGSGSRPAGIPWRCENQPRCPPGKAPPGH
jgi:isopentenyl diphosphate isomerase/L-lactate dehydrogenase-like FMN-dependent dehydrogenase